MVFRSLICTFTAKTEGYETEETIKPIDHCIAADYCRAAGRWSGDRDAAGRGGESPQRGRAKRRPDDNVPAVLKSSIHHKM